MLKRKGYMEEKEHLISKHIITEELKITGPSYEEEILYGLKWGVFLCIVVPVFFFPSVCVNRTDFR